MSQEDPQRLSAIQSAPALADALRAARERLPDADRLQALRARIEAAVAAPSTAPFARRLVAGREDRDPAIGLVGLAVGLARLQSPAASPVVTPSRVVAPVSLASVPAVSGSAVGAPPAAVARPCIVPGGSATDRGRRTVEASVRRRRCAFSEERAGIAERDRASESRHPRLEERSVHRRSSWRPSTRGAIRTGRSAKSVRSSPSRR